jgi:hypothetical protein
MVCLVQSQAAAGHLQAFEAQVARAAERVLPAAASLRRVNAENTGAHGAYLIPPTLAHAIASNFQVGVHEC